jgi:signal transduction histidine kinase/ActR/RegA family two-component response regulator
MACSQNRKSRGLPHPGRPGIAARKSAGVLSGDRGEISPAALGKFLRLGARVPKDYQPFYPTVMIRVLYAEDDPQIAELVQMLCARQDADCTLEHVDSGRRCLEAMQRGGYDVLLLDLVMPDLDGLQVLGELTARGDPTPVIMVSGHGQHELAVRALRAGAVDCIDKNSADFRRIFDIVRRVHERQGERRPAPIPPREHRVLLFEPGAEVRDTVSAFFAAQAARLKVVAAKPSTLEAMAGGHGQPPFDAIVLGPGYDSFALLEALRQLRSLAPDTPALVLAARSAGETATAAFQLGAHDFIVYEDGCLPELVFSLHHVLKRADAERLNARLAAELAELNRSLAGQVAERTRDLEAQIVVREAAERRAAEHAARLQALSNRLIRVQEDERHAIARELHDQVGQLLTGLRFQLEAARTDSAALAGALGVTDELLRTVRELTLQLRPRVLDDLGLQPALEWHVDRVRHQTGITLELDLALPAHRLAPELEITVYRVVQEALTNVARHSGATAAVVTVAADEQALHVEISDRGRGFDPAAALAKHTSLGLAGLNERVNLAGGMLEIFSKIGEGSRLHAEFPLAPPAAAVTAP